jgi:hypothetical protein
MTMKKLFTFLLLSLTAYKAQSQTIIFRTHGIEYSGVKSCDPDNQGKHYKSFSKEDRLQILLMKDKMIEVTMTENPDGSFLTLNSETTIKSAKILDGKRGKYLRVENEDRMVYIISGDTIEVHDRVSDSQTVEKTVIEETELYKVPIEQSNSYVAKFMDALRRSKVLNITEK